MQCEGAVERYCWNLDSMLINNMTYQLYYIRCLTQKAISISARHYWVLEKEGVIWAYEIEDVVEDIPRWEKDTLWWNAHQRWMTADGIDANWSTNKELICPNDNACCFLAEEACPYDFFKQD